MKCSVCGRELVFGDDGSISTATCPNCSKIFARKSSPAQNIAEFETLQFTGAAQPKVEKPVEPVLPSELITTHQPNNDEDTLAPPEPPERPAARRFPFLTPGTAADELGWLGHYRVLKVLGEGGMGTVFEAVDTKLQRSVALKVMKTDVALDEMARQRFLREARATAGVKSDHIVTIHQVDQAHDVAFLAMELLRGETLDHWISGHPQADSADILRLGIEIGRGLSAAHQRGLIHRDIKPSNIWLEEQTGRVKIVDFGLARDANDKSVLTHTGLVLGTPSYMAPEQADGIAVDARSDLFSLGCILYELAAGERPFNGATAMAVLLAVTTKKPKPLAQQNPALPPALADVIMHLLEKKPADRPDSAAAVVSVLEAIATEQGLALGPSSSSSQWSKTRPVRTLRKPRRLLTPMLGLAVLIVLGVGVLAWRLLLRENAPNRATAPGVTDTEIRVGMTGPFSGTASELGSQMQVGINTYFSWINEHGGVVGRKLKLIPLDDGYEPDRALANMEKLHHHHQVFAFLGNIGTPTAAKTIPYALENKLLVFGSMTGAKFLRKNPPDRYVFNYRASYEEETAAIVAHMLDVRKIRPEQIAVFAQQDSYGEDGFHGVVKTLRRHGRDVKDILKVGYERNTLRVDEAVREIAKHPELRAVVMVATYKPAAAFIRKVKDIRSDLIFTNVSFAGSNSLSEELREEGPNYADGVIVTQVVPATDSSSSIVMNYREALKNYFPQARPTFVSMEGYIAAVLFVEGLKRAGNNLTTDTLIEALESIHQFDIGIGSVITYGPSEHQASHKVWGSAFDKSGRFQALDLEE